MKPNNREQLKEYCLRKLGKPVIKINVADEQVEDRLDDAVQWFQEYHQDAVEKSYYVHELTAEDVDGEVIQLPDYIVSVSKVYPPSAGTTNGIFSIKYQLFLNDPYIYRAAGAMQHFFVARSYLSLIDNLLNGETPVRFNRINNQVRIDANWGDDYKIGNHVVFECYKAVDVENYGKVYDNMFLKEYATALIKMQWGNNLGKWSNITLPGGVQLNGKQLIDEAKEEIEKLKEQLSQIWQAPPMFIVG